MAIKVNGVNVVDNDKNVVANTVTINTTEAYGAGWSGDNTAPTKGDIYTHLESLSSGIEFTEVTANGTTMVHLTGYICDTTSGAFTITLPLTPSTGDYVEIVDGNDWSNNNLTVARNGQTINGNPADLILAVPNGFVRLVFNGITWNTSILSTRPSIDIYGRTLTIKDSTGNTVWGYEA